MTLEVSAKCLMKNIKNVFRKFYGCIWFFGILEKAKDSGSFGTNHSGSSK